jgi:predicted nucleic acid-binding protein
LITHLLDTSAILAHYRKQSGWEAVNRLLADEAVVPGLCAVSITELGARLKELGVEEVDRMQVIKDYLAIADTVLPVTQATAFTALEVRAQSPLRLPTVDALIAAAAKLEDAVLVHRDKHMATIPKAVVAQTNLLDS